MYEKYLNMEKFKEFEHFLVKVNERTEWQFGLRDEYVNDDKVDPALNADVEYFGFNILQDDRMRYIIENIVTIPTLSMPNKIGNTIISHFYGARGIHSLVTGESDVKKAHVDFQRIASGDIAYLDEIKRYIDIGRQQKQKFYGTTELHTSIQTAARNYCRVKYNDPNRAATLADIIEWIASWTIDGTIDSIIENAGSLKGMYDILTSKPGIGEYYGYHCATSNSVNPYLNFHHDESFCAPGPGARESLEHIFDKWKHFDNILYRASIDAVGKHADYLRHGESWDVVIGNVKKIKQEMPHVTREYTVTVSWLNLFQLGKVIDEIKSFDPDASININQAWSPWFQIQMLPEDIKKIASIYLEALSRKDYYAQELKVSMLGLVSSMNSVDWSDKMPEAVKKLKKVDEVRGESFIETFPEYRNMVLKYGY